MSSPPPIAPSTEEERKRRSTRLAIGILAVSGGCGCLVFVGAFLLGVVLGVIDKGMQRPPIPVATPEDEEPMELRLPQ